MSAQIDWERRTKATTECLPAEHAMVVVSCNLSRLNSGRCSLAQKLAKSKNIEFYESFPPQLQSILHQIDTKGFKPTLSCNWQN